MIAMGESKTKHYADYYKSAERKTKKMCVISAVCQLHSLLRFFSRKVVNPDPRELKTITDMLPPKLK